MKILALEFSSSQRSVAIADSGDRSSASETRVCATVTGSGGRGTEAFGLIEAALAQANFEREQIQCLAVGLGPGSYTGIRVAISIAQGWELAREVKLLGVSSVACLAARLGAMAVAGRWNVAVDAQRNEFYLSTIQIGESGASVAEPLRLATFAEVQARVRAGESLAGPDLTQRFPEARDLYPEAATLARIAAARTDFMGGEQLEPIYLRQPSFVKAPPPRFK